MPNHIDPSVIELSPAAMLRRRAEAIAGGRMQIARYGLKHADLVAAGCFPARRWGLPKARYQSADGQTWDGEGVICRIGCNARSTPARARSTSESRHDSAVHWESTRMGKEWQQRVLVREKKRYGC